GLDEPPLLRPLHPRPILRQQDSGRTHAIAFRLAPGRRDPALAQRPRGVEQTLAHADDAEVGAPQTLQRAVIRALALGDRLVLRADAGHAEELLRALRLPVGEVIVVATRGRPDVAIRVAGRRRVGGDVDARARMELGDLVWRYRARGMPGDAPVHELIVVHRNPHVRVQQRVVAD